MSFIRLHDRDAPDREVWVSTEHVLLVQDLGSSHTHLTLVDGVKIHVIESVDRVVDLMQTSLVVNDESLI
jgi:hypothetical protein